MASTLSVSKTCCCGLADSNQYFLSGSPVLLDAPGEWAFDSSSSSLLFWPPQDLGNDTVSCKPPDGAIDVKIRKFVIVQSAATLQDAESAAPSHPHIPSHELLPHVNDALVERSASALSTPGQQLNNFQLDGVELLGATFALGKCASCRVTNVLVRYPSFDPDIRETLPVHGKTHTTVLSGDGNLIENVTVLFSNNDGISFSGDNGVLQNVLIAFTDYLGTLSYKPLGAYGHNMTITRTTAYAFGNAGIVTYTPPGTAGTASSAGMWPGTMDVSYSHVHGGGRIGRDHSLLYTGGSPQAQHAAGVRWHHNVIHNATEKCLRADDMSMHTVMDHNVIFDCGIYPDAEERSAKSGLGIAAKGDAHLVFANTIFHTNSTDLCVPSCPRFNFPAQNARSNIFNNAAHNDTGAPCSCNDTYRDRPGGNQSGIYTGTDLELVDPANFDFRPKRTSPLVDAGVIFPPFTDGFSGDAPDIGALEFSEPMWKFGCSGLFGCDDPELLLQLE